MAIVEFTTIEGRSDPRISGNSPEKLTAAEDAGVSPLKQVPSLNSDGASLTCARSAARTHRPRRIKVGYIGPGTPYLRMQGRWLDLAGFGVGTSVRVEVSERQLIVQAIEAEGQSRGAAASQVREVIDECREGGANSRVRARKSQCVRTWLGASWYSRIEHTVAEALKEVLLTERLRERVSVHALAARTRFSVQLLRALEKGTRLPSIPVFIVLAWALDVDPRDLFDLMLKRMSYAEGSRPVLVGRAQPDIPREAVKGAQAGTL